VRGVLCAAWTSATRPMCDSALACTLTRVGPPRVHRLNSQGALAPWGHCARCAAQALLICAGPTPAVLCTLAVDDKAAAAPRSVSPTLSTGSARHRVRLKRACDIVPDFLRRRLMMRRAACRPTNPPGPATTPGTAPAAGGGVRAAAGQTSWTCPWGQDRAPPDSSGVGDGGTVLPRHVTVPVVTCSQCSAQVASRDCTQCQDVFCVGCFADVHRRGNMQCVGVGVGGRGVGGSGWGSGVREGGWLCVLCVCVWRGQP
jgi:hypothetical protein